MSVKKVKPGGKVLLKSSGFNSSASYDLKRLQSLLAQSSPRQELAPLSHSKACNSRASSSSPRHTSRPWTGGEITSEESELDKFSSTYKDQRSFSSHPLNKLFADILTSLVENRLCSEWINRASPVLVLKVLICLRLLMRDPVYQEILHQLKGINLLAAYMESVAAKYISRGEQALATQKLVTMTYMFQKLSTAENQRMWVIESGAHKTLVKLLSTSDRRVLLGSLLVLTTLAESPECRKEMGDLPIVESLIVILQEYDLLCKRMSAELLRLLSPVQHVRNQVRNLEGVPVLLSLLHGCHLKLLWSVTWILVQLCEDPDTRVEIRSWGGVQQLLRLLNSDRQYVSDRSTVETLSSANAAGHILRKHTMEDLSLPEMVEHIMALQSACCTALTELSLDDTSAHHIVQENGVFTIAKFILPQTSGAKASSLQCYAFRALRFLFSVERNRHLFKRLFPTDLFELFIDVGHYVRDLSAYEELQAKVSLFTDEELEKLRENIEAADQNRPALRVINGYAILDHLGTGAFGSVFKVQKQSGQNFLALKEVNLHNQVFGKDKKSRDNNVDKILSELTIIKEQMRHPNIVKYYKTFLEGEKLYIVMELIEGVSLAEHLNSLQEKQQRFTEDRIWDVFIQMCLALRYLHKEKRIVHRDLSPNNIMLGDKDKVTITDFGLAKQKQENSKLTSVVGTILYSCPEVVKNEPYGEKADIWALGCILYQLATLQPPFYSSNILSLANKIVEAAYEPVGDGLFSHRVTDMIKWCLTPDAQERPDIIAVTSRISDLMMRLMDGLYSSQNALERRAERDRKRAQKYFLERQESRRCCSHTNRESGLMSSVSEAGVSEDIEHGISPEKLADETFDVRNIDGIPTDERCGSSSNVPPDEVSTRGWVGISKIKPRPVSSGICVSQRKLRQIDDPIQRLLVQLHKIVCITQLPPTLQHDIKRRLVEKFKKSLFHLGSNPYSLKLDLSKLLQASPELLDLGSGSPNWWSMMHHDAGDSAAAESTFDGNLKDGVTYEQMQVIIEELLEENGYYEADQSRL